MRLVVLIIIGGLKHASIAKFKFRGGLFYIRESRKYKMILPNYQVFLQIVCR